MNRIHFYFAIAHALFVVAPAIAADGISTNSFASQGTFQFGADSWRQAAGSSQVSSALLPGFRPLDNTVSEYIATTTNRVFGSTAATNRSVELAALIHPLAEPVRPLQRSALDQNLVHASALNTVRSSVLTSPTGFEPSRDLLAPSAATTMGKLPISQWR